jgi:hypothetical protein
MPNCIVHRLVAAPTGAVLAFDCARTQAPAARFWETLGGGLGGDLGGGLPDIWNPPTRITVVGLMAFCLRSLRRG